MPSGSINVYLEMTWSNPTEAATDQQMSLSRRMPKNRPCPLMESKLFLCLLVGSDADTRVIDFESTVRWRVVAAESRPFRIPLFGSHDSN
jgi:hypothetical protein